jgi:putative SOS response-associated peptidase YedK
MCGRFTNQFTWRELVELYRITEPYLTPSSNLQPRFNFAPTDTGPVIRLDQEGRRQLVMMRWGLVPSWSKDAKSGAAMINAKAETVAEKPAYRKAFVSRPCPQTASTNRSRSDRKKSSRISSRQDSRSRLRSQGFGNGGGRRTHRSTNPAMRPSRS